jgi:hypothetical protein
MLVPMSCPGPAKCVRTYFIGLFVCLFLWLADDDTVNMHTLEKAKKIGKESNITKHE